MESQIIVPEYSQKSPSFQKAYDFALRSDEAYRKYLELEKVENRKKMLEQARAEAQERRKTVDGIGQVTGHIPTNVYLRWEKQYPGCWQDKEFRREFFRDNPECRAKRPEARHFSYANSKYAL